MSSRDYRSREERIKVLFFISSLTGGGAERVMVDILRHLDTKKIDPVLVLLYPPDNSPYRKYLAGALKIVVVRRKSDSPFEKLKQAAMFARVVLREKPAVILSMLTHNNIMAIAGGRLCGAKVIACEHNTLGEVIKTEEGKRMFGMPVSALVRIFYRFADRIVAVSEGIRSDLAADFGIPSHEIEVIYNPLDLERIEEMRSVTPDLQFFEGQGLTVIAIGRLVKQKRFDILITAFGRVAREMVVRLLIVGEGPEREYLECHARSLGIGDKVVFAGFQQNPYSLLSRADLLALSSVYEGLPMVILEALACGVPVISTDCRSGPREILDDGRYGLLVPALDENALSEGMRRLLKDTGLRKEFSRTSRERAEDFSVGKVVRRYEGIILGLAGSGTQQIKKRGKEEDG